MVRDNIAWQKLPDLVGRLFETHPQKNKTLSAS